ncbi:GNAT family N-acetyltransferase [Microvirga flavescens]|uniref:GNAT family N-acetyltransferase n=1 Tax=Microvirga flavescens TaxID=2249811 RepID=UPI000DD90709|nr:GNAT family N-acetyltransferase [Microvirga flavescens]
MGQSLPKPGLRPFLPADAPVLAEIFQASIEELTVDDYSEGQREAWAAKAYDETFPSRLAEALTLIATLDGSPVGFISLKGADHIDMFYVHPAAAGQGVGAVLYDAIEKLAGARGAEKLTVDASDTAEPFFRKRGFQAQRRNTVPLDDEWLANTTMEKRFPSTEDKKVSS